MYNPKFRHREEEELRIRLGSKYTIYNLNLPLYRYRVHNDNKTKSKNYLIDFKKKIEKISSNLNKKLKKTNLLKNVVLIVPVKGYSRRFKNKNIHNVQGLPMFIWTLKEAKKSSLIKNIFVSSENNKILRICKKFLKFKNNKKTKIFINQWSF